MSLAKLAEQFLALHQGPSMLVLPNAWDVASARIFEAEGFPAIATTSAGIANMVGYPDGQQIPPELMLEWVGRIAAALSVPVTADIEAGYGESPDDVARSVEAVVAAGAVGVNIEDATDRLFDSAAAVERIRAAREAADELGVHVVINARTDVYLGDDVPTESRFEETVRRATMYREAGADCIFVPGPLDEATISELVREIDAPANVHAAPKRLELPRLEAIGVKRVSLGSGPMRACMGLTQRLARELQEHRTYSAMLDGAMSYAEANSLFAET